MKLIFSKEAYEKMSHTIIEEIWFRYIVSNKPVPREKTQELVDYFVAKYSLDKKDVLGSELLVKMKACAPFLGEPEYALAWYGSFFEDFAELASKYDFPDACFDEWNTRLHFQQKAYLIYEMTWD